MKYVKQLSLFIVLLFTLANNPGIAATHIVSTTEELTEAFTVGENGDIILLSAGTYQPTTGFATYLILRGETGDPGDVILDLSQLTDGLAYPTTFEGTPLTMESLTCSYYGGDSSILDGYSVLVKNSVFQDNSFSTFETSVISASSLAVLEDSLFARNHAQHQGAAVNVTWGNLTASGCTFTENSSGYEAGAIFFSNGQLNLTDCVFSDNTAGINSGALTAVAAEGSISGSSFVGNQAMMNGGAISLQGCYLNFSDVQIMDNLGNFGMAGGLDINTGSQIVMDYCEILGNESMVYGGDGYLSTDSTILFHCCEIDTDQWYLDGTMEIDNEGCTVATTTIPLSSLKAMYR